MEGYINKTVKYFCVCLKVIKINIDYILKFFSLFKMSLYFLYKKVNLGSFRRNPLVKFFMIKMFSKWFENTFWTQIYFLELKLKILKGFWTHKHIFDAKPLRLKVVRNRENIEKCTNSLLNFCCKNTYKMFWKHFPD